MKQPGGDPYIFTAETIRDAWWFVKGFKEFVYCGKPRKFRGFREASGAIHLGRNWWVMRFVRARP